MRTGSGGQRYRAQVTWRTLLTEQDVLLCDGTKCRKKWSPATHNRGKIDGMGYLHWDGLDHLAKTSGLYKVMKWAAYCKNRSFREEPRWMGIRHASTWATKEAIRLYHIQIPWEETEKDRLLCKKWAKQDGVSIRWNHTYVWRWANWKPKRAKMTIRSGGALDG
jgi:hypothetical protein